VMPVTYMPTHSAGRARATRHFDGVADSGSVMHTCSCPPLGCLDTEVWLDVDSNDVVATGRRVFRSHE
jgi:hypothetical protein